MHEFLRIYLREKGYLVYPYEMICGDIGCPHEKNRFVDVVARKGRRMYAFEYKSSGDYLPRALKQVENYRCSFDYVVVVAEIPRHDISVSLRYGQRIREFFKLGAGFWTVKFEDDRENRETWRKDLEFGGYYELQPNFKVLVDPELQNPSAENHEWVTNKFFRYRKSNLHAFGRAPSRNQDRLVKWQR